MHKGEFVSDINCFYQLPSYLSNSLLSQFFWFEEAEGVNIFFSHSINFWFSLNKETKKVREAGIEVEGGGGMETGVGAVTAESTPGWQSKLNIWNQNPLGFDLEDVLYSYHQLVWLLQFYQTLNQAEVHFGYYSQSTERIKWCVWFVRTVSLSPRLTECLQSHQHHR